MAQAFDMKRLHMGCGESLQSQLPQLVYDKLRHFARRPGAMPDFAETPQVTRQRIRDKSH